MKTVLITGSNGLCGYALKELSNQYSQYDYIFVNRNNYGDLTDKNNVVRMYRDIKPHYVIHAAAKVGGIGGNEAQHGEFFYQNILMNTYMIHFAKEFNVEKFLAFSSVCVFSEDSIPLQEDKMHNGPVFFSNFSYGYAKRMVDIQIQAYKKQYGITNYCSVIPGNIFGCNDWYNLEYGHVLPSLIYKLYLAKHNNTNFVVWGDGNPEREFIYVSDLARVLFKLLDLEQLPDRLIVSGETTCSIKDIVKILCDVADFDYNKVKWDTSKPNGQMKRVSDLSKLHSLFPDMKFTDVKQALKISYAWFENNYPNVRIKYN